MPVLFGSPSIISFKVKLIFSLTRADHQEVNLFQNICAWEHSKEKLYHSSFEESQKVHLLWTVTWSLRNQISYTVQSCVPFGVPA